MASTRSAAAVPEVSPKRQIESGWSCRTASGYAAEPVGDTVTGTHGVKATLPNGSVADTRYCSVAPSVRPRSVKLIVGRSQYGAVAVTVWTTVLIVLRWTRYVSVSLSGSQLVPQFSCTLPAVKDVAVSGHPPLNSRGPRLLGDFVVTAKRTKPC